MEILSVSIDLDSPFRVIIVTGPDPEAFFIIFSVWFKIKFNYQKLFVYSNMYIKTPFGKFNGSVEFGTSKLT